MFSLPPVLCSDFGLDVSQSLLGSIMEYIVFFSVIGFVLLVLAIKGAYDAHKQQKYFRESLYRDYGRKPQREYKVERFVRIDSYFKKHPRDGQIDDITWNDLGMDEIFKRMNYTHSSTGEEYLYYTLRTPEMSEDVLVQREKLIAYFTADPDMRVKVQVLMNRLGSTGKYSLYDYLEYLGVLGIRSNRKILLMDVIFVALIILCFFHASLGLAGIAGLLVYNITFYFKEKKEIEPYIISFSYVLRLLDACRKLKSLPISVCEDSWEEIDRHMRQLHQLKQGTSWVLKNSPMGSGNPLEILMDYLNMAFHIDIMMFNRMINHLNRHLEDVDALVTQVGEIETAISISCFRASLKDGWCVPGFRTNNQMSLQAEEMYHPLIEAPVKNGIHTEKGVLLTGSNASGKSTFLKTVAINAILAQTIYTCTAERYQAPFCRIYTSMALKDDVEAGESYYIVEIKSLKRIVDRIGQEPVVCFVDEVLRGTNTVERIAASTQILRSLATANTLCFAATHDIELTELLKDIYENYHFEEEIIDGAIVFPYKLLDGKATTRNAIRLLEIMGYDERIIGLAAGQAEHFMTYGVWEIAEN